MKHLTIGMILPRMVAGGIRTHLREIIPRLRARGHKVVLVTSTTYESIVEVDALKKYYSWTFPTPLYGFMPGSICDVLQVVKECDVLHVHGYPHFLADYLTITHPCHRKPLVLTFHGSFHQFTSIKLMYLKKLHNLLMLRFARQVARFIAVSQAEKTEVIRRGIPESSLEVVYNGVSSSYAKIDKLNQRKSADQKILYLGRLTNSKNPELLIKAMPYVVDKIKNVKLIMAGADWGAQKSLEKLSAKIGVAINIEFAGEITEDQKIGFLASCDVFVHPSLQDIFALTILEASATGLPVVAFDLGGNSEMIRDGQTGILVKDYTAEALSAAIVTILTDAELAKTMGQKAREYALRTFSWEQTACELERIYCSLI